MPKTGVLLINLGSPDSPSVADVKRYLNQFLMDPSVIDLPYLLRRLVVSGFILPFRPQKSAAAYRTIWTPQGSPLVVITQALGRLVAQQLDCPVAVGMRYGNPSIESALTHLLRRDIEHLVVFPLYPHYAASTTQTALNMVHRLLAKHPKPMKLSVIPPFFDRADYIQALANVTTPYLQFPFDHLVMSYHGLPERHIKKADPTRSTCLSKPDCCQHHSPAYGTCYRAHVMKTSQLLMEKMRIPQEKTSVSFQSRLGIDRWLEPNTEAELIRLAQLGKKHVVILSPAFVADCLETLEELNERATHCFLTAGGSQLTVVPCLNTHPSWVETVLTICQSAIHSK